MKAGDRFRYFAYGSNLLLARLAARAPSARPLGTARLDGHRLTFHKHGMDGSAKCHAARDEAMEAVLHGALFEIDQRDAAALDRAEGIGRGYEKRTVTVRDAAGSAVIAETYVGTALDPALRPFRWYKAYVLAGARQQGLPAAHVSLIEAVEAIEDPDTARREVHRRALAAAGVPAV